MDNFEDRIEDYYKKIDIKAFDDLINTIEEFKNNGTYGAQTDVKDLFFNRLEKIQFSPNINFKCNFYSDNTSYYSIEYISKYRKELAEELKEIKKNYLLGFENSTPFGTLVDYNEIKKIDIYKSIFKDNTFNMNLASLYNKFDIDITKGNFINKLDIQLFGDKHSANAFIYTFHKDDQSTIKVEQFLNNSLTKIDRLFSIKNEKYNFSLKKEMINRFCFAFTNNSSGMLSGVTLVFDEILFDYSYHNEYKEFLKSHFNNNFCDLYAFFQNRKNLDYIVNGGINGYVYDELFNFLDEKNDFYKVKNENDAEKQQIAFIKCYDSDFDISKLIPHNVLDVLSLYDINIAFSNKYDKLEPEILNIVKKFEVFRDNSFYKKNVMIQNKKLKNI